MKITIAPDGQTAHLEVTPHDVAELVLTHRLARQYGGEPSVFEREERLKHLLAAMGSMGELREQA